MLSNHAKQASLFLECFQTPQRETRNGQKSESQTKFRRSKQGSKEEQEVALLFHSSTGTVRSSRRIISAV
jgi:hypothetical protein